MDYKKLIEDLRDVYPLNDYMFQQAMADNIRGFQDMCGDAATAIEELETKCYRLRQLRQRLQGAIKEWVDGVCISQKHSLRIQQLQAELEAARADMEALMWHSGDGCTICAHAVKDTRADYSKYDCVLGSTINCDPKWRGRKEQK